MAWSVRTIFLLIRGIDQTGRAFERPRKELGELELRQKALARSAYRLLFAGAAFIAFGAMALKGLSGVIQQSTLGKLMADDFRSSWGKLTSAIGESMAKTFAPFIKGFIKFIDLIRGNKLAVFTTGFIAFGGALLLIATGINSILRSAGIMMGLVSGSTMRKLALQVGIGAAGQTTGQAVVGGAAGVGLKAGIVAALKGAVGALGGTIASTGGAALALAIPIVITLGVVKMIWDWQGMTQEERMNWSYTQGTKASDLMTQFGMDPSLHYGRGTQSAGPTNIYIYGNEFPREIETEELAKELGYQIWDNYTP